MINYISIRQIIDDLLDHPLLQDLSLERIVNYTIHFIRIIGMPTIFEEKTALIDIDEYRGCLPCDFYNMIQVRYYGHNEKNKAVFRYADSSFHLSPSRKEDNIDRRDLTYKLQNNIIFTSIKKGLIEISYKAIKVDKEGYPLIPDNSSFIMALELFIKKQWFTRLFDMGKISGAVLQNVQQEYAWYVGQAQSDLIRPSLDQMESITNMLNQLVVKNNEHSKGFRSLGAKEYLKLH